MKKPCFSGLFQVSIEMVIGDVPTRSKSPRKWTIFPFVTTSQVSTRIDCFGRTGVGHEAVAAGVTGPEIAHDVIGENPLQKLWPITGGTRDIGVLVNQRPDGRPSDPSVDHLGDIGAGDHHGAIVGQAAA